MPEYEEEPGHGRRKAHQDPGAAAERHRKQEASLAAVLKLDNTGWSIWARNTVKPLNFTLCRVTHHVVPLA